MSEPIIKVADWVACKVDPEGPVGFVRRVARDGSWCDVDWRTHTKRMRSEFLVIKTEIRVGDVTYRLTPGKCPDCAGGGG